MGFIGHQYLSPLYSGKPYMGFNPLDASFTFTPGMDKRATGIFATSPIVQGKWDSSGVPDVVSFPRGTLLGNAVGAFYSNIDPYAGTFHRWLTPEWASTDGKEHVLFYSSATFNLIKTAANNLVLTIGAQTCSVALTGGAAWAAGTTYLLDASWDCKKPIDGSNYLRISINNAHTYQATTQPVAPTPGATLYIGSNGTGSPLNGIDQDFCIFRRVLTDSGGYGTDVGNGTGANSEISQAYAAGAGLDLARVLGSFDTCLCVPTNSTVGPLTTGSLDAWSHPHASAILDDTFMSHGYYGGGDWSVGYNGVTSTIDCGSGATLDNLPGAGGVFQAEIYFRSDGRGGVTRIMIGKLNWDMYLNAAAGRLTAYINLATTDPSPNVPINADDGKWYHGLLSFNDVTKDAYLALDGIWGAVSTGVGVYQGDAAANLSIGSLAGASPWFGGIGWVRLHNHAHYTPLSNFVPPRAFPGVDAGTVEGWLCNEGTGAWTIAQVAPGAPPAGNDGAITNGTWSAEWNAQATPVIPTQLVCDGLATYGNCGSDASIDNLADAEFTVDGGFRVLKTGVSQRLINKSDAASSTGWIIYISSAGLLTFVVYCATTSSTVAATASVVDNRWHAFSVHFNDAGGVERKARVSVDGLPPEVGNLAVGAVVSDAADDLVIGRRPGGTPYFLSGAPSWLRISNNDRNGMVAGARFVPPSRTNPPADDANTICLYRFNEGAGTLVQNQHAPGTADCNLTMGAGYWLNSPDMERCAPGQRNYPWGLGIGADAANDGIIARKSGLTAGTPYVARVPVSYEQTGRGQPVIVAYDEIGAATIVTFPGPKYYGLHDGAANSATLTDSTARWPQSLVGATIDNITDGSTTTITAVSGDMHTITGVLAGGTDNDWDVNDVYRIRWARNDYHPWCEPFCFTLPAGCTTLSLRLLNGDSEGVVYWNQAEVLASLLEAGDHETGAGNPYLLTGWATADLDAGDTETEATIVHSGAQSVEWNVGADDESMSHGLTLAINSFFAMGMWSYGETTATRNPRARASAANNALLQYSTTLFEPTPPAVAAWMAQRAVYRAVAANPTIHIHSGDGPTGDRWTDDIYAFALTPVTLTVTPVSAVNSAEGTGYRIDGHDTVTQIPGPGRLIANSGELRWNWTPRHADGIAVSFDTNATLVYVLGDATNYLRLYWTAANNLRLEYNASGAGVQTANWATGGAAFVANTTYAMKLTYTGGGATLRVNNVAQITITAATGFTWPAVITVYWGSNTTILNHVDAVYS